MSCVLRILGTNLDVDKLVNLIAIPGFRKSYKGHPVSSKSNKKLEFSCASIVISEAEFSEIKTQIIDAEAFLETYKDKLKFIAETKAVEYAVINFGADDFKENGMEKSFYFPPKLLALCGELNLTLELSVYTA